MPLPLIPISLNPPKPRRFHFFSFIPIKYFRIIWSCTWLITRFSNHFRIRHTLSIFPHKIKKLVTRKPSEKNDFLCCNYPSWAELRNSVSFRRFHVEEKRAAILLVFRCPSFGVGIIEFLAGQSRFSALSTREISRDRIRRAATKKEFPFKTIARVFYELRGTV